MYGQHHADRGDCPARPARRTARPSRRSTEHDRPLPATAAPPPRSRRHAPAVARRPRSGTITANGLSSRPLRARSFATASSIGGVAREVVAAEALDRHDRARPQRVLGRDERGVGSRRSRRRPDSNHSARPALRARQRLGVEAAVAGVVVLGRARGAEREPGHRGVGSVVGQPHGDREPRTAVRAVDERVAVPAVGRVEQLAQAVVAHGDVGRDERDPAARRGSRRSGSRPRGPQRAVRARPTRCSRCARPAARRRGAGGRTRRATSAGPRPRRTPRRRRCRRGRRAPARRRGDGRTAGSPRPAPRRARGRGGVRSSATVTPGSAGARSCVDRDGRTRGRGRPGRPGPEEVRRQQQLAIGEHVGRGAVGDDPVVLAEHDAPVGERSETSARSWVASTIVLPARCSSTISSTSHCWVRGSSAAVGSSNSSTSGFITSTDAIATRFFCPPDSWYGARSARSVDVEHRERVVDPARRPRRGRAPG